MSRLGGPGCVTMPRAPINQRRGRHGGLCVDYGNQVNHEDVAEFARLYAFCSDRALGGGKLKELRELSPARFDLWERMLKLSGATRSDRTAEMPIKPNLEWQKRIAGLDENIKAASFATEL